MGRRFLIALGVVIVVVACDHPAGPPSSPAPPAPPPGPTVKAITINGRTRIAPGEKESYEAIAQLTDGSTQIYTTKVQWRSSAYYVLSMTTGGQASAQATGESTVTAALGNIQSSVNVIVVPAGTYRLAGTVLEAGLPVIGAAVKVTSGQGPGFDVSTDALGQYRIYGVAGPVQVQVTKAGYTPQTKSISVAADELLDFPELAQTGAIGTYSGAYTLTLTMSPRCVSDFARFQRPLPAGASTRTYPAVVTQEGPRLSVSLSGANFNLIGGRGNQFDGHVEPTGISFKLGSLGGYTYDYYYYHAGIPDVAERLSSGEYLSYLATAKTTASPGGLSGPLNGIAMVFSPGPDGAPGNGPVSMCWASDHQFSLTPQTTATRIRR